MHSATVYIALCCKFFDRIPAHCRTAILMYNTIYILYYDIKKMCKRERNLCIKNKHLKVSDIFRDGKKFDGKGRLFLLKKLK